MSVKSINQKQIAIGDFSIGNNLPFVLIAGPCQMESRDHAFEVAQFLKECTFEYQVPLIYKSSFDKANRTSVAGTRGLGLDKSLQVFEEIKSKLELPILTDIHDKDQCEVVSKVVDILQIPAFLCRQTDLLIAAGNTGSIINIKKGQFLAPWDMTNVAEKVASTGNKNIILTERGSSFGYNTLVNDIRAIPIMAQTGFPIIIDATHSVQQPGGQGASSGGQREFAPVIARAAVAVGVAGVFLETHPDPDKAPSDGPNMIILKDMPDVIRNLKAFDTLAKNNPVLI
jgi:2-dehydro-3-deoxyphosphooctonate aldolase (KDO 8-P synthase)